jgi:tetratricopeptide (TPR) repeat protein
VQNKVVLRPLSCAILALELSCVALSQSRPAAPASPNPTPNGSPPDTFKRPDSVDDTGPYGFWAHMTDQGRAGGALIGNVNVEGDPLLWEPVLVSIICQGNVVNTTRTDPSGRFAFTSVPGKVVAPADVEREMKTHYEGCKVQASLSGFSSDALTITERNLRDDPQLGTIWMHLDGRAPGTAVSFTSGDVPKKARKSFMDAHDAMLQHNPDQAQKDLEKAVRTFPGFAEAWYQLGKLQLGSNPQDAQQSFAKAVAADPKFILPYEELAQFDTEQQKWSDALANTSHSIELNPSGSARIWYLDALANYQLSKLSPAKSSALKSLAMDPRHQIPNTEQLLAVILARQGDYAEALQHLHNCLTYIKAGPNVELLNQQIAQLEHAVAQSKPPTK